jgi:ribosomal protein S18 acetylase RimI-like enzyme
VPLTVEPMTRNDRREWEALYRGYAEFYRVPMNDHILDSVWSWIHDDGNAFYGRIARRDSGEALGFIHCRSMPSPLRGVVVGFLDDLFVAPPARGQGVVEALFEALREIGRSQGWPFIRWITAEDNYRGRAVYDRIAQRTGWTTYQMEID